MNTAIINTLLNTDLVYFFPALQPGKDAQLLTGIHKDFTPEWYVSVGQALAGVVLPACITPNIMLMMQYPIAIVKRYFLAGCVRCVCSSLTARWHSRLRQETENSTAVR